MVYDCFMIPDTPPFCRADCLTLCVCLGLTSIVVLIAVSILFLIQRKDSASSPTAIARPEHVKGSKTCRAAQTAARFARTKE